MTAKHYWAVGAAVALVLALTGIVGAAGVALICALASIDAIMKDASRGR